MYNMITRFFFWLLPIVRTATIQVLAEEIHKLAYPERPHKRRVTSYNGYDRRQRRSIYEQMEEKDRLRDQAAAEEAAAMEERHDTGVPEIPQTGFHDVLLVAFDLSGPNAYAVHQWLHSQMPKADRRYSVDGGYSFAGGDVTLDSWWVANDQRFDESDCDSAVFVHKGYQGPARDELKSLGLAH